MHLHEPAGNSDRRPERHLTSVAARSAPGAFALLALILLGGCTSTQSQIQTGGQVLPRPAVVVVDSFAVSLTEVSLSEGLSSQVAKLVGDPSAIPRSQQELQVGHQVADAIANNLVTEIRDLGMPAERGNGLPSGTANAVLVTGQLVSIDQGNQAERVVMGLAAGRSDVRAQVQVFELTPTSAPTTPRA
jgi:hypothetical protein